eukprot:5804493-Pleurochrysis_carterae.AAC.1
MNILASSHFNTPEPSYTGQPETTGKMSMELVYCRQRASITTGSMPAATPKRSITCFFVFEIISNASKCAKVPVTTGSTLQLLCKYPELVPERVATTELVHVKTGAPVRR